MGSRPPNSDHDLFWCKFGFGKCFGASSWSNHFTELVITGCRVKPPFFPHVTIWSRNGSSLLNRIRQDDTSKDYPGGLGGHFEMTIFFFCSQLMRHPHIELFYLSNLLQISNNHRMVNDECFSNFSCSCERINFFDPLNWSLSLPVPDHYTSRLQGSCLLCKTSWLITALYIH